MTQQAVGALVDDDRASLGYVTLVIRMAAHTGLGFIQYTFRRAAWKNCLEEQDQRIPMFAHIANELEARCMTGWMRSINSVFQTERLC